MAIDSKEKRAAVLGVGRPWMRDKFPVATPDEEWRIASGNAYGGNALSPAAAGDTRITGTTSGDVRITGTSSLDIRVTSAAAVAEEEIAHHSGLSLLGVG